MTTTCPSGVTAITLLALHDDALAADDADRLRAHVPTCASCTAYMEMVMTCGHVLRRQRVPAPLRSPQRQDRLWRELRAQIGHRRVKQRITYSNHMLSHGTRSLGIALALLALFLGIMQFWHGGWGPLARPSAIPILTANLSHATDVTIPAYLAPSYISSDANTIIGVRFVRDQGGVYHGDAIARYTIATGTLDILHTFSAQDQLAYGKVASDGRYAVWASVTADDNVVTTPMTLTALDLQTMRTQRIADKPNASQIYGDYTATLDHGYAFWQDAHGSGNVNTPAVGALNMTNLATGTTATIASDLAVPPADTLSNGAVFQESWPYVVYRTATADTPADAPEAIVNIATDTKRSLPRPPVPATLPTLNNVYYALAGTTVLASWAPGDGSKTFAELDSADQTDFTVISDSTWRVITTISQPFIFTSNTFQASDSLLVFTGATTTNTEAIVPLAWDRYRQRLIQLVAPSTGKVNGVDLFGGLIALEVFAPDHSFTTLTLLYTSQVFP